MRQALREVATEAKLRMDVGYLGVTLREPNPIERKLDPIEKKLNEIIIPKVDFENATVTEAIRILNQKSVEMDTKEPDPAKRGITIVSSIKEDNGARITLNLSNVPIVEALRYVCQLTNLNLREAGDEVVIEALPSPAPVSAPGASPYPPPR
jgi:hypothetical protein